jgi:hypothetical protein
MVARSTRFHISGSSISPSAFCSSDFSPWAAASCLNPCSTVARHKRFMTLVSRFRPFACWPPSQPSYAFHPHHRPPILRSHDTRGPRHHDWFQRLSLAFRLRSSLSYDFLPHHCLLLSMLFSCTSHADPNICSSLRPIAFQQLDHHPAPSIWNREL